LAIGGGQIALVEVIVYPQAGTKKHDQQIILVRFGGGRIDHPARIHLGPLGGKIRVGLGMYAHQKLDEGIIFAHRQYERSGALGPAELACRVAAGQALEFCFPARGAKPVTIYQ